MRPLGTACFAAERERTTSARPLMTPHACMHTTIQLRASLKPIALCGIMTPLLSVYPRSHMSYMSTTNSLRMHAVVVRKFPMRQSASEPTKQNTSTPKYTYTTHRDIALVHIGTSQTHNWLRSFRLFNYMHTAHGQTTLIA